MNLDPIQTALRESALDGWLFYDHHHRDPIAASILGLDPNAHISRRWYYFIPATGEPSKLVHRIERSRLDCAARRQNAILQLAGTALRAWRLSSKIRRRLPCSTRPITTSCTSPWSMPAPSSSCVRLGKEIVSSADLVSQFEAVLTAEQIASHSAAQREIDVILDCRMG